ncbi:hypothetical protein Salat_1723900 [Sesamum alatum]|uniref:Uncharacterized protein n=1 Tax=Sesamum alatum TaxID=300844 RepID=A0AAE2CKA3_9LAMI|nr:hypothetical protein Salat_1723900 [Sesamum alatum]
MNSVEVSALCSNATSNSNTSFGNACTRNSSPALSMSESSEPGSPTAAVPCTTPSENTTRPYRPGRPGLKLAAETARTPSRCASPLSPCSADTTRSEPEKLPKTVAPRG